MKTNKIFKVCLLALSLLGNTSCTDQFDNINTDKNNPTNGTVDLLLNPIIRTLVQGQFNYYDGAGLAHTIAHTNYNEIEQYAFDSQSSTWDKNYLQLNNIDDLINNSKKNNRPSCEAIGYILRAFVGSQLTDLWGDVPFSEASKGSKNIYPKYDYQKDIYTAKDWGIIALLNKADKLLDENTDVIPQDIVYKGDRIKWRKLANSLCLRYLIRISNRKDEITEIDVVKEIESVSSRPLMNDNSDNFSLPYLSSSPNKCPIFETRAGNFEYTRMSKEISDVLNKFNDPRMTVWFAPTTNSKNTSSYKYAGVTVGCSATTLQNIGYSTADVSLVGDYYRATPDGCSAILMNCSEVKFLQAEAITKNYYQGNAKNLYEDGIKKSMEYYKVTMPDNYLTQDGVKFDSSKAMEQIMQQKWLSLFFVGYESWFDFLRTGLPKQDKVIDNRNPSAGEIPSRFYYPEDEQALNGKMYKEAILRQGGTDNINTKLWWEK